MASIPTFEDLLKNLDTSLPQDALPVVDPNSPLEQQKVEELSAALDVPQAEVEQARGNLDFSHSDTARSQGDIDAYISALYDAGVPLEEATTKAREYADKQATMVSSKEFMFKTALLLDDGTVNKEMFGFLQNFEYAQQLIAKKAKEQDPNWAESITGFLEVNIIRGLTVGLFEDLSMRSNREGETYIKEMMKSPEEFAAFMDDELNNRMSEGFLPDFGQTANLSKTLNDLEQLGNDPAAGIWSAMAAVDIATLGGFSLAKGVAKAGVKGTKAASQGIRDLLKAATPTDAVAAVKGDLKAAEHVLKVLDEGTANPVTAGRAIPESFDTNATGGARPSNAAVVEGSRYSMIFESLEQQLYNRGVLGRMVSEEAVKTEAQAVAKTIAKKSNNIFVKLSKIKAEGSDNYVLSALLGKANTGKPFASKAEALAAVNNSPEFTAVRRGGDDVAAEFDLNEAKRGWYLKTEERIDVLKLPEAVDDLARQENFIQSTFAKVFGATSTQLGTRLGTMITQAESALGKAGKISKPFITTLRKSSVEDLKGLENTFNALRDGEFSYLREAPTEQKFKEIYRKVNGGKEPSGQAVKGYYALLDLNNAAWHIRADAALKEIVQQGGRVLGLADDFETIGFRIDRSKVPASHRVYDINANKSLRPEQLKEQIIYKVTDPYVDHVYVTGIKTNRLVEKTDAYGYNVGGPRNNDSVRWFVGLTDEGTLAGGNTYSKGFKTLLGSFGEKEAKKAVEELNNIVTALKPYMDLAGVRRLSELTLSKADAETVKRVILRNNSWNKHITEVEDLAKLADDYDMSFYAKFVGKARDEAVTIADAGLVPIRANMKIGDLTNIRLNRKRGDTPFMAYGGGKVHNTSPIQNMMQQFDSATYGYLHMQANQASIVGWVKKARESGLVKFQEGIPEKDYLKRFLTAEVTSKGSASGLASQLASQQNIIRMRLGANQSFSSMERFYNEAAEFVFEKTGKMVDPTKVADGIAGTMMSTAFRLKMSFLNFDQFILQAFHVSNIMAISPAMGTKAVTISPVIRGLMAMKGPAREAALNRIEKLGYVARKDIEDVLKYMDESGRDVVNSSIIEVQGSTSNYLPTSKWGKIKAGVSSSMDKTSVFFNEGELLSRIAAIATAVLEHNGKNISRDVFSDAGRTWVTNREQALTFRMTSAQKGAYQQGLVLRVASQWLTYSNRFLENLVLGRDFSKAERSRLALVNLAMFGTTATGFGSATAFALSKIGVDPSNPEAISTHNLVKYGLFDKLLSEVVGEKVSYGTRAAPFAQFFTTYRDIFIDKNLVGAATGPSGEIVYDTLTLVPKVMTAFFDDRPWMAISDLTTVLRNVKTVDTFAKMIEIIETGQYRSKNRGLAAEDLKPEAAFGVLIGATPMVVLNNYDAKSIIYSEDAKYKETRKYLKTKADTAMELIRTGESSKMARGVQLWEEIKDIVDVAPFSEELRQGLRRNLVKEEYVFDILDSARKQGSASQLAAAAAINSNVGTE